MIAIVLSLTDPPVRTIRLVRAQDVTLRAAFSPPRDVTGWAVTFRVRDALAGTQAINKTVGAGVTLTDTGLGIITVALAKADTSSLTVSTGLDTGEGYVWEIKRTDAGSEVILARGQLILEQEVIA